MQSRRDRPDFAGKVQYRGDRRKGYRRKSDVIIVVLKYLIVALAAVAFVKFFKL